MVPQQRIGCTPTALWSLPGKISVRSKNDYQDEECPSMRSRVSSTFVAAGLFGLAVSMSSAQAGTVLVFGQTGTSNQMNATNNGMPGVHGGTTLSATDVQVTITEIASAVLMPESFPLAFFNLSAVSTSDATVDGKGRITQDFTGYFSITSVDGVAGVNYLSGTFRDAVFGEGTGLGLTASGPTGVPTLTSGVIGTLGQSRAISLSFTNVVPPLVVTNEMTLGTFSSSVAGSFSAVPAPASLVLLGIGVAGICAFRHCFKRTGAA
jgi:hypothetical protein